MKKALFAVAAVALLAVSAQAGEIKTYNWPSTLTPLELTTIPVTMDIGYWIRVKDQDKLKIKMVQQPTISNYKGCTNMVVECNVNIHLSCSITSTGEVGGDYSCSITNPDVAKPGATVEVCAELKNANLKDVAGGTKDKQVATVLIKVVPTV